MISFSGSGTYNGLSFVLRRSKPIIDVPLGRIAPPSVELYLYNSLLGSKTSKLVSEVN